MAFKNLQFELHVFADPRVREFRACEMYHAAKDQVQLMMEAVSRPAVADADFVCLGSSIKRLLRL